MITTEIKAAENKIQAFEDGRVVGILNFETVQSVMSITHTYAYEEGKGVGKALVIAALKHAQQNHWKVNPVCSYARVVMERNPEYQMLLADAAK